MPITIWECKICAKQYETECIAEECEIIHKKLLTEQFNIAIAAATLEIWKIGIKTETANHRLHNIGKVLENL